MKTKPKPFLVAVVMAIALTIFFGAWAVSADIEARTVEPYAISVGGSFNPQASSFQYPSTLNGGLGVGGSQNDGVWWQRALLVACPLH